MQGSALYRSISFLSLVLALILPMTLSSCTKNKLSSTDSSSKMLFRVTERDFETDEITEYRIFENGKLSKSIMHGYEKLFDTDFKDISTGDVKKSLALVTELQNLDYQNFFPWKETVEERGNIIEIEFPISLNCNHSDDADCKDIWMPKTFLYYTNHDESPALFSEIMDFVKSL